MVGGRTGPFKGAALEEVTAVESNWESWSVGVVLKKEVIERWAGSLAAPANWRLVREFDIGTGFVGMTDLRLWEVFRFGS